MPPTQLDHCVIRVSARQRPDTFYAEGLGATAVTRDVGFAYRFGDKQLDAHGRADRARTDAIQESR